MKTLYIDCGMGAAGDMLTAALLELTGEDERAGVLDALNALGIPGVKYEAEPAVKCGITGTHMHVLVDGREEGDDMHDHHHDHEGHDHHHEHHHASMHDINHIVSELNVSDRVRRDILAVYGLIAEAESVAHGRPVSEIHFHEVGTMDAVADVTAVCVLMERLNPDRVVASPVHVGSGQVRCAHGILPVPAPATAYILRDVPIYGGEITGELCTPTGAALLKHFATSFGSMPVMQTSAIGYGMGRKDFPRANCVRAMLGESISDAAGQGFGTDAIPGDESIITLECNIDDMTGEAVGFAVEELLSAGARDVFTVPIQMKKNRPGILLSVICTEADREKMVREIFRHTSTVGIRESLCRRYILDRNIHTVPGPFGDVRVKESSGYGVSVSKPEYEDLARIAREQGMTLDEVSRKYSR